ncbi:1-deoxy-11-beta-hydroxypentalenate dehydrogenase [compost metagenome]
MERAADRVAFDAAGAQISAHVRAEAVENVQLAVFTLERHQAGAKHVQAVGLAITVLRGQAQAVPTTGVAVFQQLGFNAVQGAHLIVLRCITGCAVRVILPPLYWRASSERTMAARWLTALLVQSSQQRESKMSNEQGRVAVITGAASGIGRGLAEHAAGLGMQLVLADVDGPGLQTLCTQLQGQGAQAIAQVTDVSDVTQVERLRDVALAHFQRVDLLFNNAGVMQTGYSWEISHEQWQRMLAINLQGTINGIRSFVPLLLKQGHPAQVINTASLAGLLSSPLMAPYNVTKQAVVALSETLQFELSMLGAQVSVSVLCPGPVASEIMASNQARDQAGTAFSAVLDDSIRQGMTPRALAAQVFAALAEQRFWIFPHKDFKPALELRLRSILEETNPQFQMIDVQGDAHAAR